MIEYLLSTNKFNEPKIFKDNDARALNLLRLLLLTTGHNPLFPKMGCNLVYYRHITEDQIDDLQKSIEQQIETYLPECQMDYVELVETDRGYLNIIIQCADGVQYQYASEDELYPLSLDDLN